MLDQYDDVLTVTDLQEILSVGRNFAYDLLRNGEIPSIKVGKKYRIPKEAVLYYLSKWKQPI